jgi:hypothetical protein
MKKELLLSLLLAAATPTIFAQQQGETPVAQEKGFERPQAPASTFQQVDKIRKALNLDQKQFEKVYKAYETYNKAIFGDSNQAAPSGMRGGGPRGGGMGGPGGGGMGGPGGGGMGPGGGGMGGPGGGMGPGNGGGRPDMDQNSGSRPTPPKEMSEKDMEKLQKKMQKQEEKLSKSVRKAIKDDATFTQWQEMRRQETMPPKHDNGDMPPRQEK